MPITYYVVQIVVSVLFIETRLPLDDAIRSSTLAKHLPQIPDNRVRPLIRREMSTSVILAV